MRVRSWLLPGVLLAACAQDAKPTAPPGAQSSVHDPERAPSSTASRSSTVSDAVRKGVCAAEPCGAPSSIVRVYRDDANAVKKLYRVYGACFHSPGIYFDPDGTKVETIPEKPIEPESEAGRAIRAKHETQVGGLRLTEEIRCEDGSIRALEGAKAP